MSLSCIAQTLWDMCQVIIEATVTFICHLDKNGCKLEQNHFIKNVGFAYGFKKE